MVLLDVAVDGFLGVALGEVKRGDSLAADGTRSVPTSGVE
jgi:hypothetical protein